MKEFWNNRFNTEEFIYGKQPNQYLKEQLELLNIGTILFPAEGEGRNAVFAAKLGWTVSAFDISIVGKNKAQRLAETSQVQIDYQLIENINDLSYENQQFDVIAFIYAHFPSEIKSLYHKKLLNYLRKDGIILLEGFSKKHLEYNSRNDKVGGPKDIAMLFSMEEIASDFENFDIIELVEKEVDLNEGAYHNGLGSVIRFVGRKK